MRLCSSSISSSSLLLLSFVLLLLLQCCTVEAQQNMPFAGNGEEPPEPTTVFVSTYIDRLMYIDDKNYEFQALVFVYLSWTDPRAKEAVAATREKLAANSSAQCKTQCQLYPTGQPNPVAGCCDDVWLPYVSFSTLKMLSQDRIMRWGVNVEPNSDAVAYWSIILGTFMASFDLRAFPFDTQRLQVQMEIPGWAGGNVKLKPSSGGTRMFNTNPDGDALSGWKVMAVRMATYNLSLCQRYTPSSSQPSALDDPAPLVSQLLYQHPRVKAQPGYCAAVLDQNRDDPSFKVYTRQNLDGSTNLEDRPLNVSGVTCTIVIKRFTAQWVMSAILPIVASAWLGYVTFLLPRDCLNSRLGAVMTIFVAVAAIQFVVAQDLPNSSYMTALQQIIATGYVALILIAIDAVIIWFITTYHSTGKRLKEHQAARQQFEVGVKSELETLKLKLAALVAEQEQSNPKRGLSKSFGNLKALQAARSNGSFKFQHMGNGGYSRATSASSTADETASTAAAAVKDADLVNGVGSPAAHGVPPWAASRNSDIMDVPVNQHDTKKNKAAAAHNVLSDVDKLQQQLDDYPQPEPHKRQQVVEGPISILGLGHRHVQGREPAAPAPHAAAVNDAVLLHVESNSQERAGTGHIYMCFPWRLCTRVQLYLQALQHDETLTDQLSYQLNKWLGITQFIAYNLAIGLIFLINWLLYRKH